MAERIIPLHDLRRSAPQAAPAQDAPLPAIAQHVPLAGGERLVDRLGRPLRDLRISVTDRCNFRCSYCMPKEVFDKTHVFLPHSALLSFEEITRTARTFVALGVRKLRLTGGEPLLRKNLESLVAMLAELRTLDGQPLDITLTTNGSLLARKARALKDAGLQRVTVSLDALDDVVFRRMNDVGFPVADVLRGIEAAQAVGLAPIKVNMVVKRGTNDHEVLPLARHFRGSGIVLRFIEYMDVGATNGWRMDEVLPSADVIRRLQREYELQPIGAQAEGETAERWAYADGGGEIGVISSVTQAFCRDCNRARLSTEGRLFLCLFASAGHDLRALLRGGASDEQLAAAIATIWRQRSDRYSELRGAADAAAPDGARAASRCTTSVVDRAPRHPMSAREPGAMPMTLQAIASCVAGYDPDALPVAQAQDFIARLVSPVQAVEMRPIRDGLGRVLARDVVSAIDVPAHDNSAMDGFALRGSELRGDAATRLRVVGSGLAGNNFAGTVPPQACVMITTGGGDAARAGHGGAAGIHAARWRARADPAWAAAARRQPRGGRRGFVTRGSRARRRPRAASRRSGPAGVARARRGAGAAAAARRFFFHRRRVALGRPAARRRLRLRQQPLHRLGHAAAPWRRRHRPRRRARRPGGVA